MRAMPANMDVLQNIEFAVTAAFKKDLTLTDHAVLRLPSHDRILFGGGAKSTAASAKT